jgi:DNA ligase 1
MPVVLLARVAATSAEVAATSARSAKVGLIAACLREAAPAEVAPLVAYLSGDLPQRRTGVGWASLRDMPAPAEVATLTIVEVDRLLTTIAELAGKGRRRSAHDRSASCSAGRPNPNSTCCAGCSAASCVKVRWRGSWSTPWPAPPRSRWPRSAARP